MKLILVIFYLVSFTSGNLDDFDFTDEQIFESREYAEMTLDAISTVIENIIVSVDEEKVSFKLFNNATTNINGTNIYTSNVTKLTHATDFDENLKTVFITHGWNNNCTESPMIATIKDALLAKENVNIFTVCWDEYSLNTRYLTAYAAVRQVGKLLGQFINNISITYNYSLDKFTLIGHSLGAHVSGFAGKELGGSLPHIVGLDPAGPLYSLITPSLRLADTDSQYVEAIHSAGALLGVAYNVGDVDFWPNGGLVQPGCGVDIVTSCAHGRSYYYYAESLQTDNFLATECSSYTLYNRGICKYNDHALMGGIKFDPAKSGTYYLKTNSKSPFGMGDVDL